MRPVRWETRVASRLLTAVFVLAAVGPTQAVDAQEMHAVFIGINDYIEFEDEPGGDLLGAEADALAMRAVLTQRWGLNPENSLTLLSREATRAAIEEAVTGWLAGRVEPGDLALFYFAGHGAQVYDLDGDEPDALDETLAPADVLMLSSENDIKDDEFRDWLATIGTDVVVILDSCHSGTATRASTGRRSRSLDRPLPPEGGAEPKVVRQRPDPEAMADGTTRILELAAAAPSQTAMEGPFGDEDGQLRGAFTHFLVSELTDAPEEATYIDVLRSVTSLLERDDYMQIPQITGVGAKALFRPGR